MQNPSHDREGVVRGIFKNGLAFQGPAEEAQGAGPGVLRGSRVVDVGAGIVEEGVVGIGIDAHIALDAVFTKSGFESFDLGGIDPLVFSGPEEQHRTADVLQLVGWLRTSMAGR